VKLAVVLTADAENDLDEILIWSHFRFGGAVRDGYEALIMAGVSDIANDPGRAGAPARAPTSGAQS
jgi:plasmid stabilization system protein ParE